MTTAQIIQLLFVAAMVAATIGLGAWATRRARTAGDFFVAGRSVSAGMNAAAISGEYLSAASFMGVAGLVMRYGYDSLWYPACYAAGYLFLLLFIAGPLRRFGAYTIPDFAEGRFDSPIFRKIAVTFVLFIGFFYTMPQMKGAGITMGEILNWPYWAGIVAVGVVITYNVATGGMKGITFVQAFQYWAKMFAISVPAFVVAAIIGTYPGLMGGFAAAPKAVATTDAPRVMDIAAKAPGTSMKLLQPAQFEVLADTTIKLASGETIDLATGTKVAVASTTATGSISPGTLQPGKVTFLKPTKLRFDKGSAMPSSPTNEAWLAPYGELTKKHGFPLLYTYSLIVALVCGTAGLPHILVRFYTNPDGRSAKKTTFIVMILIGTFYMFTPVWGAMGRAGVPELYGSTRTDSVVISLPKSVSDPLLGAILSGITAAGAFAAFMSTFSGLLVSMSGAFAHDIYGRILRPGASPESRLVAFKVAAVGVGVVSMGLGLLVESFDIAKMVGWAFAIGAASYFPLLLVGSWWRGLTMIGAASGMLLGGLSSLLAIVTFMLIDKGLIKLDVHPIVLTLMEQPAIFGVPLSILTMILVSKATASTIPQDIDLKMLRLHAPEEMGVTKDYIEH